MDPIATNSLYIYAHQSPKKCCSYVFINVLIGFPSALMLFKTNDNDSLHAERDNHVVYSIHHII